MASLSAKRASAVVIVISATQARPKPPPMAQPPTTAITTCGAALIASKRAPKRRLLSLSSSGAPGGGEACATDMLAMSPPAQNVSPAPRKTTIRTDRSGAMAANAAAISSTICELSALRRSGRLSQRFSTPPRRSSLICKVCGGSAIIRLLLGDISGPGKRSHRLADNGQHDFVGAAADRHQAAVAKFAAHRRLVHVTHAAPILQATIADFAA